MRITMFKKYMSAALAGLGLLVGAASSSAVAYPMIDKNTPVTLFCWDNGDHRGELEFTLRLVPTKWIGWEEHIYAGDGIQWSLTLDKLQHEAYGVPTSVYRQRGGPGHNPREAKRIRQSYSDPVESNLSFLWWYPRGGRHYLFVYTSDMDLALSDGYDASVEAFHNFPNHRTQIMLDATDLSYTRYLSVRTHDVDIEHENYWDREDIKQQKGWCEIRG